MEIRYNVRRMGFKVNSIIAEINARRELISLKLADADPAGEVRLLDYACGAGTVSKVRGYLSTKIHSLIYRNVGSSLTHLAQSA
jgi:hypothetical protein